MNIKSETVKAICFGLAVALILLGNFISDHNKRTKEQPAPKTVVEFPLLKSDHTGKTFEALYAEASTKQAGNQFLCDDELESEIKEAVNLATDPAQFPNVQELMRGNTRYFKAKSDKHLSLLTQLYHSEECPVNVRTTAISCLNQFYSSTTRAEILIHLVNTQPGDVLIEKGFTKFEAQNMLKNPTYQFKNAQKVALLKIANP